MPLPTYLNDNYQIEGLCSPKFPSSRILDEEMSRKVSNVSDTVSFSGLGGAYTWNADGTLASYPGPGYTRKLDYDEEGRLTKISRDNGSTITPVFEYG